MTTFFTSFSICPVIDSKFHGVTEDKDPDCILVTLGKRIIMRFRLSDQKQLSSWTTNDKLTLPAIYDRDRDSYVAVFNGEIVSSWLSNSYNRKKLRKYKLPKLVHNIHLVEGMRPLIVFKTGMVGTLDNHPKNSVTILSKNVMPNTHIFSDTSAVRMLGKVYLTVRTQDLSGKSFMLIMPLDNLEEKLTLPLVNGELKLSCLTVLPEKAVLTSLWSNGEMFEYDIAEGLAGRGEFPGRNVATLNHINLELASSMVSVGESRLVLYAADPRGEGAVLSLVNTAYGVLESTLHLKLYSSPPCMWLIANSYIILPIGLYLTVIPFRPRPLRLDSMIGAKPPTPLQDIDVVWEPTSNHKVAKYFNPEVKERIVHGIPESIVCQDLINSLLEENKVNHAVQALQSFDDIPDKCVLKVLTRYKEINETNRNKCLMDLLCIPLMNDKTTLALIRDNLSFEFSLELLHIIVVSLETEAVELGPLINWVTLLLDSHYQQFLLTKSEQVTNQIMEMKKVVSTVVEKCFVEQELFKFLTGILKTKVVAKPSVHYTVDKFKLY